MKKYPKRTWAEIDLSAICENYIKIRTATDKNAAVMAVVKADAYGHGAPVTARILDEAGADRFAVSNIEEAQQLRRADITKPILILGYTEPDFAHELAKESLTQTVHDFASARALSSAAAKAGTAIKIHIKIDTGMCRLGIACRAGATNAAADEIERIISLPSLVTEGVFTHFSSADEPECAYSDVQFNLFCGLLSELEKRNIKIPLRHAANSAALLNKPETHLDLVRPGIILYGMYPDSAVDTPMREKIELRPAMSFKSALTQVKTLEKGSYVSYGRTYEVTNETKEAVIPAGYADGYSRSFSNRAYVLIDGKKAPVIGRVCMDMFMADVTGISGAQTGSQAVLFGDGLPVEYLAKLAGTVNYELTCLIGKRVPRVYYKDGNIYTYSGGLL